MSPSRPNARSISSFTLPAVALVALFGAGCLLRMDEAPHESDAVDARVAPPAPAASVPAPAAPVAATDPDVLVWVTEAGARTTYRIATGDERLLRAVELPGVHIGAGDEVFSYAELPDTPALEGCEGLSGELIGAGESAQRMRALVTRRGSEESDVVVEAMPIEGLGEAAQSIELLGSVGPYLFVKELAYGFACGAHGNTTASFTVWDAAAHASVVIDAESADIDARRRDAIAHFEAIKEEALAFNVEETFLTALVPQYGPEASLTMGYQFTTSAPHAFSDALWSSYTISTVRPSSALPAQFAIHARAPDAVRAVLRAHPRAVLGGWSYVAPGTR